MQILGAVILLALCGLIAWHERRAIRQRPVQYGIGLTIAVSLIIGSIFA